MIKSFLNIVATDLHRRFGNNLSGVTIVFPGKRASMWMNQHLFQQANGPVWAPRYTTIDALFQRFTTLIPSDPIRSVCTLYDVYRDIVPDALSADDFYGWGEILLSDFEDIDKHLVDVGSLFRNAADLQEMEGTDFLEDSQIQTLQQFFSHFDPEQKSALQQKFLEMWNHMPQLYDGLRQRLLAQGMLYPGGIYRQVAEQLRDADTAARLFQDDDTHTYCFVGFNVLDDVEETLFRAIRDQGRALFYWDYDTYYIQNTRCEAGLFLRRNLQPDAFPNALGPECYDNLLSADKHIRVIATSTDNAQVRYLPTWLGEHLTEAEQDCAVVLCDEALMRPVLHSIPSVDENPDVAPRRPLNVTMGFPLTDTPVYGFFTALLDLQVDGYDPAMLQFFPSALDRVIGNPLYQALPAEACPLVRHTDNLALLAWLQSILQHLGAHYAAIQQPSIYEQLYSESTFQLHRTITQFHALVTEGLLQVGFHTLRRLMLQMISSASIPFHGEMQDGMQVMGLLETRNLDFSHLLMLSVGEGILPKKANDVSLIPYCLREPYGLSTIERKISVFAYYFYRIIQRATDITLVYNENSSGTSQREQSRFIRQLLAETDLPIQTIRLTPQQDMRPIETVSVPKDERVMQILRQRFSTDQQDFHNLSPSALNSYLECPLRFYYQQVAGIRMPDRPQEGIDAAHMGTIFHDTCQLFYLHLQHLRGDQLVTTTDLDRYLTADGVLLYPFLDLIFWVDHFHPITERQEREAFLLPYIQSTDGQLSQQVQALYQQPTDGIVRNYFSGICMLVRDVLHDYLVRLLQFDRQQAGTQGFTIRAMEQWCSTELPVPTSQGELTIRTGGIIDRLDLLPDGTLRIVDYKTSLTKKAPSDLESIFQDGHQGASGYYLQTMLYSMVQCRHHQGPVQPALFYVPSITDPVRYDPTLRLGKDVIVDFHAIEADYRTQLTTLLSRIFEPQGAFTQCEASGKNSPCQYCDYRSLCGRK